MQKMNNINNNNENIKFFNKNNIFEKIKIPKKYDINEESTGNFLMI